MMQVAVDQIIGVIAMRNSLMPAASAMAVIDIVRFAFVSNIGLGIIGAHAEPVLVYMPLMNIMKMAVMQVVGVALVLDASMATSGTVLVRVAIVNFALFCHGFSCGTRLYRCEEMRAITL